MNESECASHPHTAQVFVPFTRRHEYVKEFKQVRLRLHFFRPAGLGHCLGSHSILALSELHAAGLLAVSVLNGAPARHTGGTTTLQS